MYLTLTRRACKLSRCCGAPSVECYTSQCGHTSSLVPLVDWMWLPQGLEEEMVATIALDVLKGLDYMHAHSMLHRDVKVATCPYMHSFLHRPRLQGSDICHRMSI